MIARFIGTVCFVGHVRPAPGTWGSLAALPLAWLLHVLGSFPLLAVATLVAFFAGWWATQAMTVETGTHDPSEIVVDELVGQWLAIMPMSFAAWSREMDILVMWPGWISAFVLFRLFDIWKPGPVGWADRRDDALGVMLDDVIAGLMAAFGVVALAVVAHGVLM